MGLWGSLAILFGLGPNDPGSKQPFSFGKALMEKWKQPLRAYSPSFLFAEKGNSVDAHHDD
jgi:hypothetical protein